MSGRHDHEHGEAHQHDHGHTHATDDPRASVPRRNNVGSSRGVARDGTPHGTEIVNSITCRRLSVYGGLRTAAGREKGTGRRVRDQWVGHRFTRPDGRIELRAYRSVDRYVVGRLRRSLRRRHQVRSRGTRRLENAVWLVGDVPPGGSSQWSPAHVRCETRSELALHSAASCQDPEPLESSRHRFDLTVKECD
jgi:hypothetical protein